MTIDTSGKWWKGESFEDLADYIRQLTADTYPADRIVQSVCGCGNTTFHLLADQDEGCAQRICTKCQLVAFICDSAEQWDDAEPVKVRCSCKRTVFELGIGFSMRAPDEVRWITIGQRCIICGTLGSYVDWKIDYGPSEHLLVMA